MRLRNDVKDRWLLSYADFITLLFAVFVLMYASAKAKEGQGAKPARAVQQPGSSPVAQPQPPFPTPASVPPASNVLAELKDTLKLEQQSGLVSVSTEQRGITITLDDQSCFQPGDSDVRASAMPMFAKVAGVLAHHQNRVLLEGHTDSIPIHNSRFRSNWELSTARSIAVMQLMEQQASLQAERFSIGGSADNVPVSSNGTEQGRAHNRRVDIIVLEPSSRNDVPGQPSEPPSAVRP